MINNTYKINAINTSTNEVESIELLGGGAINDIINILHPIGSIYMSFDSTNPKDIFGGEWEQIKDRFIYAAGEKTVNTTGGEENHKLTIAEMPTHEHLLATDACSAPNGQDFPAWRAAGVRNIGSSGGRYYLAGTTTSGDSQSHNNMPPYLVAYVWKRIK